MKNKVLKNFRTIASCTLALLVIVSSFGFVSITHATGATLTIGSQVASNGASINVPVTASNFVNIAGVTLTGIQFDNTLLRYDGYTLNALPVSGSLVNLVGNQININWSDQANPMNVESGTILTLNFTVISATTTNASISFEGTNEISDSKADIVAKTLVDGVITLNPVILSNIATVTSSSYTIGTNTITNVPFGTSKDTFLAALSKGQDNQTWNDSGINNPVVTGNTLVVTAQDGATTITYTVNVNAETTPPTISLFYPADNATNVSVNVQPTLTFSEAIDTSTMNGVNIELREYATLSADATKVPALLTYSAGNKVTFVLSSPLKYNKQYYFWVGTGVKDIAGNSFAADTWYHDQRANHEFTTEAVPLSSISITSPATKLTYTVGDALDITGLVVTGHYSDNSTQIETIAPSDVSGFNSSTPVTGQVLTITFGGKTTTYTINVVAPISSAKDITSFSFAQGEGVITGTNIAVTVPFNTIVTTLVPTIVLSGGTVSPLSGVAQDFTSPVTYTVTAEDTSTKVYTVTVTVVAPANISALTTAKATAQGLIDAKATESTTPNDHIVGSLAILTTALSAANATEASSQSVVDGQVSTLNSAISAYNLAIVPLSSMTAYDATLASKVQTNYTTVTWDAYQLVVTANVVTNQNTQAEVDTATANITTAQNSLIAKAGLEAYTAALATVSEVDYTTASWTIYQVIVKANVVTTENTQEEVATATGNITAAQANLVVIAVMTAYNTALSTVTEVDYTLASWATYQGVVSANVVTNQNTQAEVDAATANIVVAQGSLVTVAEANAIALLNTAKGNAGALTQGAYTVESWAILTTALNLPETTTTQIITKTTAINNAISNLVLSIEGETFALTPVDNEDDTVSGTITDASEATTVSSGVTVTFNIPADTTITGPTGWDGTINLPTVTTSFTLTPDSGNTASAVSAIEVGLGDTPLTLDKAVKLTFKGLAGKLVGWSQAGVFHQITSTCNSATNPTLDAGADCKIDVGSDLVVWTKHFTSFVTYTQTTIHNSSSGSSGGYIKPVAPTLTEISGCDTRITGFSTVTGQSCATNISHDEGKVLGVTAFNFTKFMKNGSKGSEIIELQKFLTTLGYTLTADGKFGPKTNAAVIKFQIANGLKGDGIVGALTRAALNK